MSVLSSTSSIVSTRVLVADDQRAVLDALSLLLKHEGCVTEQVTRPYELLQNLNQSSFDLVLMDLNYTRDTTSGAEGLDLISEIRKLDYDIPVLVMTAWGNVPLAIEAMHRGASDFIEKPWDNRELLLKLSALLERSRDLRRAKRLRAEEEQQARFLQQRLTCTAPLDLPGYQVAAWSRPSQFVGGDFYALSRTNQGHAALCLGDVSGKGVPAALLASSLKTIVSPLLTQHSSATLCAELNRFVHGIIPDGKFVSCFCAQLDPQRDVVEYCNAGHTPALLVRRDGSVEKLESENAVLGHFADWNYVQAARTIMAQDILLMFTDGITEACDINGEEFGESRLADICQENRSFSAQRLLATIVARVSEHCSDRFSDDATLLVLKAESDL